MRMPMTWSLPRAAAGSSWGNPVDDVVAQIPRGLGSHELERQVSRRGEADRARLVTAVMPAVRPAGPATIAP